jgi:hypothetical protein
MGTRWYTSFLRSTLYIAECLNRKLLGDFDTGGWELLYRGNCMAVSQQLSHLSPRVRHSQGPNSSPPSVPHACKVPSRLTRATSDTCDAPSGPTLGQPGTSPLPPQTTLDATGSRDTCSAEPLRASQSIMAPRPSCAERSAGARNGGCKTPFHRRRLHHGSKGGRRQKPETRSVGGPDGSGIFRSPYEDEKVQITTLPPSAAALFTSLVNVGADPSLVASYLRRTSSFDAAEPSDSCRGANQAETHSQKSGKFSKGKNENGKGSDGCCGENWAALSYYNQGKRSQSKAPCFKRVQQRRTGPKQAFVYLAAEVQQGCVYRTAKS